MWIFGYGSLIWRPDFDYVAKRVVVVHGVLRRFWQGSPDHRGTPQQPGRVVTLVDAELAEPWLAEPAQTWGVAFQIEASHVSRILDQLDDREVAGYDRLELEAYSPGGESVGMVMAYRAGPLNPNYLGPAPQDDMVRQILAAKGESGSNKDYLLALSDALSSLGLHDPHVASLSAAVRNSLARR